MRSARSLVPVICLCVVPFMASCDSSREPEGDIALVLGKWELVGGHPLTGRRTTVEFLPDGTFATDYFETDALLSRAAGPAFAALAAPTTKTVPTLRHVTGLYHYARRGAVATTVNVAEVEEALRADLAHDGYAVSRLAGPVPGPEWLKFVVRNDELRTVDEAHRLSLLTWKKLP